MNVNFNVPLVIGVSSSHKNTSTTDKLTSDAVEVILGLSGREDSWIGGGGRWEG